MLLALIRHGIAEDAGPSTGYRDEPRRLTHEGAERVRAAAVGMARLGIRPDAILTSPLARCAETAELVAAATGQAVRRHDVLRPGAQAAALLDVLAEYPDAACVLACGHQPDMSAITRELTGGRADYRRGTLGLIELAELRPGQGILVGLYPAKVLRRIGVAS
jgi:phosphohistidine phosphatase